MVVTKIEEQKKKKDRVNVYLDGHFAFGLTLDLVWQHHLKEGQELHPGQVDKIKQDDAFAQGYDKALAFLAARPRSTQEVRQRLRDKLIYRHPDYQEVPAEKMEEFRQSQEQAIDAILLLLKERGFVDDVAFAKWWIQNRQQFNPRGKRLMLLELMAKGVSNSDLQEALLTPNEEGHFKSEASEEGSELTAARQLAQKYLAKQQNLPVRDQLQKLMRHLASKGFDWDTIHQVTAQLSEDE
jgi:regulatory protein